MEDLKAQQWSAVLIDLAIVILGVFIALEVANWNSARQDRQEERRYYRQLLIDLRVDLAAFKEAQRRADRHDDAAQLAIDRLNGNAPPQVSRGRMATAIHYAGFIYIPRASRGTYDELISTGNLRLLRNSNLKSQLARYYGTFDEVRQWDPLVRDQQSDYWTETAGVLPRPVLRAAIRDTEPTISQDEDRDIWQAARSRPRLPNMLVGMAGHQERIRRDSERHSERATKLIADIKHQLEDGG